MLAVWFATRKAFRMGCVRRRVVARVVATVFRIYPLQCQSACTCWFYTKDCHAFPRIIFRIKRKRWIYMSQRIVLFNKRIADTSSSSHLLTEKELTVVAWNNRLKLTCRTRRRKHFVGIVKDRVRCSTLLYTMPFLVQSFCLFSSLQDTIRCFSLALGAFSYQFYKQAVGYIYPLVTQCTYNRLGIM